MKIVSLFFLLLLFISCQAEKPHGSSTTSPRSFSQFIQASPVIARVQVKEIKPWEEKKDGRVVRLEVEKIFKGKPSSRLDVFEPTLFEASPPSASVGESLLVFLQDLPAYTAYAPFQKSGIRYQWMGNPPLVFRGEEIREVEGLISFWRGLEALPSSTKFSEIKNNVFQMLQTSPLLKLHPFFVGELALLFQEGSFSEEDWKRLEGLFTQSTLTEASKLEILEILKAKPSPRSEEFLRTLFCLSPESVCLKVAEFFEARHQGFELSEYAEVLQKASPSLQAGLLEILGRHQRQEAFAFFQKILPQLREETLASAVLTALGNLEGQAAEALCLAFARDRRYFVRLEALQSLGRMKSEKAIPFLEKALRSQDPSQVTAAASALKNIASPKALETLKKYYEKDPHGYWEASEPKHFMPSSR